MREYTKKAENQSHIIDRNPKASRQAPASEILQAYKERIINSDLMHQKSVEENLIPEKSETVQTKEKPNNTGLPEKLKTNIENLSGYTMDDVHVHYNSDKPTQLKALAYTEGTEIYIAPGQEKHLPHEAWHVIQQKQGRVQPTRQMQGMNINDSEDLEKEADLIGEGSLSFNKINNELCDKDIYTPTIQKRVSITITNGKNNEEGESGNEQETKDNMAAVPEIKKTFNDNVKEQYIQSEDDGKPYKRNWAMCAEPNAFSKLLRNDTDTTLANLGKVHFTHRAYNDAIKKYMKPCRVCEQWIDSDLYLNSIFNTNYYEERYKKEMDKIGFRNPDLNKDNKYYKDFSEKISQNRNRLNSIKNALNRMGKKCNMDTLMLIHNRMPQQPNLNYQLWIKTNIIEKLNKLSGYENWDINIYYPLINQMTEMQKVIHIEEFTPEIIERLTGKFSSFNSTIKKIREHTTVEVTEEKISLEDYLIWYDNIQDTSVIATAKKIFNVEKISHTQFKKAYTHNMEEAMMIATNQRRHEQLDRIRGKVPLSR